MQIIIISSNGKAHRHWQLTRTKLLMLVSMLFALISLSTYSFANWSNPPSAFPPVTSPSLVLSDSSDSSAADDALSEEAANDFYARQLGGLQAETIRLKMLSLRLAEIAGLDTSETLFGELPGQGGIDHGGDSLSSRAIDEGIERLYEELLVQQNTLSTLEQYLMTQESIASAIPVGKPVREGWVSSFYGYRIDPFNGKKTFHRGLDFAGKTGTSVISVADGIVSWAGERGDYGGLVEVDHGNGYVTRYAHNKTITVQVGDRISKGQELARMGSTGRSTGPHVHFEVLRDGKHVNPYNFIK